MSILALVICKDEYDKNEAKKYICEALENSEYQDKISIITESFMKQNKEEIQQDNQKLLLIYIATSKPNIDFSKNPYVIWYKDNEAKSKHNKDVTLQLTVSLNSEDLETFRRRLHTCLDKHRARVRVRLIEEDKSYPEVEQYQANSDTESSSEDTYFESESDYSRD